MKHLSLLLAAGLALVPLVVRAAGPPDRVTWSQCLRQKPAWYATPEAVRIADNVLAYQYENGGWDKNIDMAQPLSDAARDQLRKRKPEGHTTIDNGATHTQMAYLARVNAAAPQERFKSAYLRGLDYLLAAQYPSGGWPQYYPLRKGYYTHITFNDNAMVGVLNLLRGVARREAETSFVDEARREKARRAVERGTECILKCQVEQGGKPAAWCAQHDEETLKPAKARAYELPSLSGAESVGLVRFLMEIEKPGPEVVRAVEGAVAWLQAVKITGIKVVEQTAPGTPKGRDRVVVADPAAGPLWARFYELDTNQPFFCGRDGVVKYRLAEIEYERRNGYAWYGDWAAELLAKEYPAWKARVAVKSTRATSAG